jgi:toluene monooxygenase electron transfer component
MRIEARARNATHEFACEAGEKILHAGLRGGIALPYECGTGTCGTCRARLLEGRVEDGWPEAPGRSFLTHPEEFLMCQAVALDDCALEIAVRVSAMAPGWPRPRRLAGVVAGAARLTDDVIFVRCEPDQPLPFEAGQFVIVEVPEIAGGRAYSMVNFACPAERLDFVIKKKPDGRLSEWLFRTGTGASGVDATDGPATRSSGPVTGADGLVTGAVGATVSLFGPLGHATFTPDLEGHLLCVAGGSGIAGMMSILARATEARHFERFEGHVFFGVRRARDLFFLPELAAFKRRSAGLRLTVALSDEAIAPDLVAACPDFAFDTGLVHEVAGRHMKGRFDNVRAWVAGPPPMVDASIRMLLKEGRLAPARIRYDKFS